MCSWLNTDNYSALLFPSPVSHRGAGQADAHFQAARQYSAVAAVAKCIVSTPELPGLDSWHSLLVTSMWP